MGLFYGNMGSAGRARKRQGRKRGTSMDPNVKIPLSILTNTLKRSASRATSQMEKKYLFELTEALGTTIAHEEHGVTVQDFIIACGVNPEWGKVAA
jgi:hypothetical protein